MVFIMRARVSAQATSLATWLVTLALVACGAPVDEGERGYSVTTVAGGQGGAGRAGTGGVGGAGRAGSGGSDAGKAGGGAKAGSGGNAGSGGHGGTAGTVGSGGAAGSAGDAEGGSAGGGPAAGGAGAAGAPKSDAPPTKRVLDFTWKGQETSYWCGPGSTRMALSTRMNSPPSQTQLATYMGTTENGTDHVGLVAGALNHWLATSWFTSKSISDPPGPGQEALLKKDIVSHIGKEGYPLVANVVSGWRPPGYPGGTIYHYVAIVGYDASGDEVMIADPAAAGAAGPGWNSVPKTYWVSLHDLAVWIGGKGYAG